MQNETRIQSAAYLPNILSDKLCKASSLRVNLEAFKSFRNLTPDAIDSVVEDEMKQLMADYAAEEECFVNQQLIENPVICERRPSTRSSSDSGPSNRSPLQQQRAESCRKSRFNNKIKKAQTKFRHEFITKKLAQNAVVLESIKNVIAYAENSLRSKGCSEATLKNLRNKMGVGRMEIENLPEITI